MRWLITLVLLLLSMTTGWAAPEPDITITYRDQSIFAVLQPDGTVLRAGVPHGSISPEGRVVVEGEYLGDVKSDDRLLNREGKEIGRITPEGLLYFRGELFMKISPTGPISRMLDEKTAAPWGKYKPTKQGFLRLRQLAAVVLFFQGGLKLDD